MIFDTHAHYDDTQFDADRDELLKGMASAGDWNHCQCLIGYRFLGEGYFPHREISIYLWGDRGPP